MVNLLVLVSGLFFQVYRFQVSASLNLGIEEFKYSEIIPFSILIFRNKEWGIRG
jgi:hypothetical protein